MSSTHASEMRFTNQIVSLKKADKIHLIFPRIHTPTLPYYTRVKFELILLVSLNISCFVKYNLYLVCVSR